MFNSRDPSADISLSSSASPELPTSPSIPSFAAKCLARDWLTSAATEIIGVTVGPELPSALLIRRYKKCRSKDPTDLDAISVVTSHDNVRVIR